LLRGRPFSWVSNGPKLNFNKKYPQKDLLYCSKIFFHCQTLKHKNIF